MALQMNHDNISRQLGPYMDGEVAAEQRAAIEAHLRQCEPCASLLRELQRLSQSIRQMPLATLDGGVLPRLHAGVDRAGRRPLERFVGLLSGIAACLAMMGGLMLLRPAAAATLSPPARWEGRAVGIIDDSQLSTTTGSRENALGDWMTSDLSAGGAAAGGGSGQ